MEMIVKTDLWHYFSQFGPPIPLDYVHGIYGLENTINALWDNEGIDEQGILLETIKTVDYYQVLCHYQKTYNGSIFDMQSMTKHTNTEYGRTASITHNYLYR